VADVARRCSRRSQRIAWWLLKAAKLRQTVRECERCGGPIASAYAPNVRHGLEIWSRCSTCGWSVLQLAQPHGERVPFVPPAPWTTIEAEIAAMRAAAIE
jgi:ribosomal protein S27AE